MSEEPTPPYRVNDTATYHREGMKTLGWELTVCNALEDPRSPCRELLETPATLGNLLYDHLASRINLEDVDSLIEIGGGYGFVMRDFQSRRRWVKSAMLDLSPVLLARQRETLAGRDIHFIQNDFFNIEKKFFGQFDLALLNEIIGDFPTICDIDPAYLALPDMKIDGTAREVKRAIERNALKIPGDRFNLNLGALLAVERLCDAGVRHIYLSEHSCEASAPEKMKKFLGINPTGNPCRIPLMGHDEYTVKFSDLVSVAEVEGYHAIRGSYSDFIRYEYTNRLHFILTSGSGKDDHEIIRQFVEDIHTYEYLILSKG